MWYRSRRLQTCAMQHLLLSHTNLSLKKKTAAKADRRHVTEIEIITGRDKDTPDRGSDSFGASPSS